MHSARTPRVLAVRLNLLQSAPSVGQVGKANQPVEFAIEAGHEADTAVKPGPGGPANLEGPGAFRLY